MTDPAPDDPLYGLDARCYAKNPRDYRKEEWIAHDVDAQEVDAIARRHTRGRFFVCAMVGDGEPDGPTRSAYKGLGYRLLATEGFFVAGTDSEVGSSRVDRARADTRAGGAAGQDDSNAADHRQSAQRRAPFRQRLALDIFKELVEINTVVGTGDTARAAEAMAARLRAAGFSGPDVQVLVSAWRKGNLVARLRGTGKRRPILLLAHIDVVDAKREDWSVDPFRLTERDGYFYGRGTTDNKFMAAAFVANLIRYKQEGYTPERDIILALETDEEIFDAYGMGILGSSPTTGLSSTQSSP